MIHLVVFYERQWLPLMLDTEVCFWGPDSTGAIQRKSRVPDGKPGLSRYTECVLHQGRMEAFFLDAIKQSYPSGSLDEIVVERCTRPTALEIDEANVGDSYAYPVKVTIRKSPSE